MTFLYKADPERGAEWQGLFAARAPDLPFRIWPDIGDPLAVRYFAAWAPPDDLIDRFPNLEILFSVGAGVDQFDFSRVPSHLPVVRMVEPGIIDTMVEFATLATLALHRDLVSYVAQQKRGVWQAHRVRPAATRRVGVMGLGLLGQAVLRQLRSLKFDCAGWNRSPRALDGIPCFVGTAALPDFLARTDILICLLPLTDETRGILGRELFARLPAGAALINTGRGGHLVEADLLAALETGQLSAAILDVAEVEPLPAGHPFWGHERILLTPHIASMAQPETAVSAVLDNLRRHRSGEPLVGLVDRGRGY